MPSSFDRPIFAWMRAYRIGEDSVATSHQDSIDPAGAQTPEAFMELLRQARGASGLSIVEVAERARKRGYDLDPVELARALESPVLPEWQTVTGVLAACGLGGMQIDRWMRVYHDLAAPAQPVAAVAPETAIPEPMDEAPVSVPPLLLRTEPATPPRLRPRHYAIAAGVLAVLVIFPLMLFALFNDEPDTVSADAASPAPRPIGAPLPAPSPTDVPVAEPSPTEAAAPTTPAPVTTTTRPPTRTTPPPPPPPPPPSPPDPGVLRSGVVGLTGNGGFDLDSDGEQDIRRWNDDTLTRLNGSRLEPVSGMPSKQDCQAEQGWQNWVENLHIGQWLCVYTSDNRYGRLNITAVGDTLKLVYTIWT